MQATPKSHVSTDARTLFAAVRQLVQRVYTNLDRDDLTQEVMYRLLSRRLPKRMPIRWLNRFVKCRCIDLARQQQRERILIDPKAPSIDYTLLESAPAYGSCSQLVVASPAPSKVSEPDTLSAVLSAIHALPPKQRQALCLCALGHTYADISALTGVPVGTVRSRISCARKQLADHLAAYI